MLSEEKIEKSEMKIEMGQPIVVAQAKKGGLRWGVWQFPGITSLGSNLLEVSFNRSVDDASLDSAKKLNPRGVCISQNGGKTWQHTESKYVHAHGACLLQNGDLIYLQKPPSQNISRAELPEPVMVEHGYGGSYMYRDHLRMPKDLEQWYLMRKPAGKDEWEHIRATIDDPDGGITCYDPPDKDYAVVHWRHCMQVLEIPDGSLLAIFYGHRLGRDRKPRPKCESFCLRSTDKGHTWKFRGIIARDDNHPLAGYSESRVTVLPDGTLLAVLRTEVAKTGPMYRTRSTDGGKTWDSLKELCPFGVLPQLLTFKNGVTVLSFGRPGVHLLFNRDGKGEKWDNLRSFVVESFEGTDISGEGYGYQKGENPDGRPKQTRTSGYTSLVATGPDQFVIAYDQFDYPNEKGEPRKTILVQNILINLGII